MKKEELNICMTEKFKIKGIDGKKITQILKLQKTGARLKLSRLKF